MDNVPALPLPRQPGVFAGVLTGLDNAYQGDEELSTGIARASVQFASQTLGAVGGFFDSLSSTLADNPKIVDYFLLAASISGAYVLYRRFAK